MPGYITDIQHRIGESPTRFERGDLVFDAGTVLYRVDKGWPGKIHKVDRNDYLQVFGVPPIDYDDGYHAWFALHNYQNTVGHYVRVMASDAEYGWLDLRFPVSKWLASPTYAADDLAYLEGKVYQSAAGSNTGNNPVGDDGTWWTEYDNNKGNWVVATDYISGDVVADGDLLWVSQTTHTAAAGNQPTLDDGTNWLKYFQTGSGAFDSEVAASGDSCLIAWLKNGATADNLYGLAISDVDAVKKTFKIGVYQNVNGVPTLIEDGPHKVGFDNEATSADGSPLFVEAVFEQLSDAVGITLNGTPDFSAIMEHEGIRWFTGGNPGGTPTLDDYKAAWALFEGDKIDCDQFFMAGDTDPDRIAAALQAADEKKARLECDTPGGTAEADEAWARGMGLYSHLLSFTYGRVSFRDPFYPGSRKILGLSGFATAAKAWCREKNKTPTHPSVWEAPAGYEYGRLRGVTGIRNEKDLTADEIKTLAEGWINYLSEGDKGLIFWEQYTYFGEESRLSYKRQVDVMNYVYKVHREVMKREQFRQRTDKQIINALAPVLEAFLTEGVLVYGTEEEDLFDNKPFQIWITRTGAKRTIHRMMRLSWAVGPLVLETILA